MGLTLRETWRPSQQQELLVRAALGKGESAASAWEQWVAATDGADVDAGSSRFFPLLFRNLQRLKIEHPLINRFGVGYRRTWATNQVAMRHLAEIIEEFEKRGISTLVLKGAALAVRYYKDVGTRPMADFDLLVPVEKTDAAMETLVEQGWYGGKPLHLLTTEYRSPFHGMGFHDKSKPLGCDLHWHVMHLHLSPVFDAPMWEAAVPLQIGNQQTRALCAEHQLIHLLFNGCMNEEGTNMRWLPDALIVLQHEREFRWDYFVEQCQRLEFTGPVAEMLTYLQTTWSVDVPAEIVGKLTNSPVSYHMRQAYAAFDRPKNERTPFQVFWLLYTMFVNSQPQRSHFFPFAFMRFLSYRWSLAGLGSTLRYGYQRMRGITSSKAREMV